MGRIKSFESLRGLLALWVVLGHTIKNAGFSDLFRPGLAVDIFIMLSGFVIFFLLDKEYTTYRSFIVKRWFRLAPVYLALLFVSMWMLDWQEEQIANFPFRNASIANNIQIGTDAQHYFVQQGIAHVLMIHGAIADWMLPSSQYAFLGAAWSISVEWQFYLLAPLFAALIHTQRWRQLSLAILGICALRVLNYGGEGFAVNQAGYFIVGIGSFYIWKHCGAFQLKAERIELLAVVAAAAAFLIASRSISLVIWIVVLSCILTEQLKERTALQALILKALHSPALQWLGKISYSVYLVHMLVFYVVRHVLLSVYPDTSKTALLAMLLASVPAITVLLSALTYHFIERPGMELGKRFAPRPAPLVQVSDEVRVHGATKR